MECKLLCSQAPLKLDKFYKSLLKFIESINIASAWNGDSPKSLLCIQRSSAKDPFDRVHD